MKFSPAFAARPAGDMAPAPDTGPMVSRMFHPPVRDLRFWVVQALLAGLAVAHFFFDIVLPVQPSTLPSGIPVALLLAPVSYAALRYGLAGSIATAIWATVLWLPDMMLPHDEGHVGNDLIELTLVIAVAIFVGYHIDGERLERTRAQRARTEQQAAEARYQQLFDINAAPILVAGPSGQVLDANPAARALTPSDVIGMPVSEVLGRPPDEFNGASGNVIAIATPLTGTRDYRVNLARVPADPPFEPLTQLVLEDVTEERAEGIRVQRFAEFLLKVQEEERRRIAQELHDEPLQLLIHLARSLEELGSTERPAADLAGSLEGARRQTVDVATRIRAVVAGLRPPALEQLGLAAALRGFLADIRENGSITTDFRVTGAETRLTPEVELAAFRIAQEAANNVIKHSQATHLSLDLDFGEDQLSLRVADNGTGFDPGVSARLPGSMGMLGMRERAALARGSLTVQSSPGRGTVVQAVFADTLPHARPLRTVAAARQEKAGQVTRQGERPQSGHDHRADVVAVVNEAGSIESRTQDEQGAQHRGDPERPAAPPP